MSSGHAKASERRELERAAGGNPGGATVTVSTTWVPVPRTRYPLVLAGDDKWGSGTVVRFAGMTRRLVLALPE